VTVGGLYGGWGGAGGVQALGAALGVGVLSERKKGCNCEQNTGVLHCVQDGGLLG